MEIIKGLVSVLIPVFNNESTIEGCIRSVLSQTYRNWEMILFFDGSTDNSLRIAQEFQDENIMIIVSKENIGIAGARNKLLKEAKGEFIAFIDADDFMLPNRLQTQSSFLIKNEEIDICGSAALLRNYLIRERMYYPNHDLIQAFQFFKCGILFPTLMTRNFYDVKENLFDESFGSRASDFEWIYRIGRIKKIANLPVALTSYYVSTPKELQSKKVKNDYDEKVISLLNRKCSLLLGSDVDGKKVEYLHYFLLSNSNIEEKKAYMILDLLMALLQANKKSDLHDVNSFQVVILIQVLRLKKVSNLRGIGLLKLLNIFGLHSFYKAYKLKGYYR